MEVLSEPARMEFEEELDVEEEEEVDYDIEEEEAAAGEEAEATLQDAETARCDKQGVGCTAGPSTSPDTQQFAPKMKQGESAKPVGDSSAMHCLPASALEPSHAAVAAKAAGLCGTSYSCGMRSIGSFSARAHGPRRVQRDSSVHITFHAASTTSSGATPRRRKERTQQSAPTLERLQRTCMSCFPIQASHDPIMRGKREQPCGLGRAGSGLCLYHPP